MDRLSRSIRKIHAPHVSVHIAVRCILPITTTSPELRRAATWHWSRCRGRGPTFPRETGLTAGRDPYLDGSTWQLIGLEYGAAEYIPAIRTIPGAARQ